MTLPKKEEPLVNFDVLVNEFRRKQDGYIISNGMGLSLDYAVFNSDLLLNFKRYSRAGPTDFNGGNILEYAIFGRYPNTTSCEDIVAYSEIELFHLDIYKGSRCSLDISLRLEPHLYLPDLLIKQLQKSRISYLMDTILFKVINRNEPYDITISKSHFFYAIDGSIVHNYL